MASMLRLILLILCLASAPLTAAPQGYHSFSRKEAGKGLLSLFAPAPRLDAWFFRSADFRLVVLDEGDQGQRYGSLAAAMQESKCHAGINGSYFADNAQHSPLGLLRHEGRQVTPLASGSFTVAGVLYDTGRELRLERSTRLSTRTTRMREAIQGGPFLVEDGRKVRGLNATRRARRSLVATDGEGNWCLAMSSPLTLDELADWLASGKALGSFRVQTALNLDGGTSSAFWCASPAVHKPSVKAVRNYIGMAPRTVSDKGGSRTARPAGKVPRRTGSKTRQRG